MITVYGFGPVEGLPDVSPFVTKVIAYLKMAGVPYQIVAGNVRKAPKRKLPYIEDDGKVIPDSSFIINHVRRHYKDLDEGLSAEERAHAVALKALCEEAFYFVYVYLLWIDDRGWAVMGPSLKAQLKGQGIPGLLSFGVAKMIRKQVTGIAYAQGIGRYSLSEVEDMGEEQVSALFELLGDKRYFLGTVPRAIDASTLAFLWSFLDMPFHNRVKEAIRAKPNLVAYCRRMREQFFKP